MDMDAATRRATPPWATEDVPRDQQIVRGLLSGDGPQMSVADAENVANSYRVGYNPKPLNQSHSMSTTPEALEAMTRADWSRAKRASSSMHPSWLDAGPWRRRRRPSGTVEAATRLVTIAPAGRLATRPSWQLPRSRRRRRKEAPTIDFDRDLTVDQVPRVVAHEVGHAIDSLSGKIGTKGLSTELKQVYHDLATGRQGETKKQTLPQHLGYPAKEVRDEMVAEAVRAYIVDPHHLKSVAPETAKRIREAVNTDPRIAKVIQFNQGGAPNVGLLQDERGGEPTNEPVGLLNY
jgi:hypothetical protein